MPSSSGSIIPNNKLGGGGTALGGGVVFNVSFPNYVGSKQDLQRAMQEIAGQFKRNNGTPIFA